MSFKTYGEYNDDNVVRLIENDSNIRENDKEGLSMNEKLNKAWFVWVDVDKCGKMNHRFEKTMNNRWFDWNTYISYTDKEFREILGDMTEGKEYDVFYA